jgi:two-component system aerobic respiration control protein ArcA
VLKISKLIKERISSGKVVQFKDFSNEKSKTEVTVLLIEDEESIRKSLKRILEDLRYRVIDAKDAMEFTKILSEVQINLIVLDVGLPWVNGFELAEMMKADLAFKNIPIVFISGHNDKASIKKGFAVGAHDYILKPFDIEKVKKTIQTLLKLHDVI